MDEKKCIRTCFEVKYIEQIKKDMCLCVGKESTKVYKVGRNVLCGINMSHVQTGILDTVG